MFALASGGSYFANLETFCFEFSHLVNHFHFIDPNFFLH